MLFSKWKETERRQGHLWGLTCACQVVAARSTFCFTCSSSRDSAYDTLKSPFFRSTLPAAPLMSLTASSTGLCSARSACPPPGRSFVRPHGTASFSGACNLRRRSSPPALAAEVTDGRPEPDGDNHDDKDEKDDIFRSHCSASFLGEGDAAPRRTSPSVNGSMFLLVFGLLAMSAAVSCALSAIRAADADFPPFFGPIQVKQDSADDADQDGHNDDVYHNFTGSWAA